MKFVFGIVLLLVLNGYVWTEIVQGNSLRVTVFDVGQGDSILIETRQGHQILIDGGPDNTVLERLGEHLPPWDRSIDLMVLTHGDADHISGLPAVLEHYSVKQVLWTGVEKDTNVFARWKAAVAKEEATVSLARAGQKITWQEQEVPVLLVLNPTEPLSKNINNTSIVLKLLGKESSMLLTADIEKSIEKQLATQDIQADVLKVAHHGSKSSTTQEFLQAVNPKVAVISVGKNNRYDHPHQEILARLSQYGIQIRRTDLGGTIFYVF